MRTLITADLHLTENPRDDYRFRFLDGLPSTARKLRAERVLILGDLTEQKDRHPARLVNRIVDGLAALAETAEVWVLRGNHDYIAEDAPFYRFLRHIRYIHWIGAPRLVVLNGLGRCALLPHAIRPADEWRDLLGAETAIDWCFCHQTFNGAHERGRTLRGVDTDLLPKGARIISGDIHVPQILRGQARVVTYVGAPYTIDFGDDFDPRLLLIHQGQMQSVPIDGPRKRLINVAWNGNAERSFRHAEHADPGDIVKIRIELTNSDIPRAEIRASARAWAQARKLVVHEVQISAPTARSVQSDATRAPQRTDADLIRAYARQMNASKALLRAGLELAEINDQHKGEQRL